MKKVVIFMSVLVFAIGMTGCKDEEEDKKSTTKQTVYEYDGTKWREEVDDEGNIVSWECITETDSGADHVVLWEDQTYWDE